MIGLLRSELFRVRRRWMTLILSLLAIGLPVLTYFALWVALAGAGSTDAAQQTTEDLKSIVRVANVTAFGDDVVWQLTAIMGIVLLSSLIGNEFAWRTVLTLTAWTGQRWQIVLAKIGVASLLTFVWTAMGFAGCFAASVTVGAARGTLSGQVDGALLRDVLLAVPVTWAALLPYVLLSGTLTMLSRNTAIGISVGLAVLFLEGLAVIVIDSFGSWLSWIKLITMNWNVQGLLAVNGYTTGIDQPPDPSLPGAWQSMVVLLVFAAGYVATTAFVFQRRDLTE